MAGRDIDQYSPFEPTLLEAVWRYWWIVALSVAAFGSLAFAFLARQTPGWVAQATLIVEDPRAATLFEQGAFIRPERYVENQVEILQSAAVAQRASELATSLSANQLLAGASVGIRGSSDLITVSFRRPDREQAVEGANAIALAYQDVRRAEAIRSFAAAAAELDSSIADIEADLSELQREIEEFRRSDAVRAALEDQYQDALEQLAAVQSRPETVDLDALQRVQSRLAAMELVLRIEAQRPRQAALLEEQRRAIDRLSDLTARRDELEVETELSAGGVAFFSPADGAAEAAASSVRTLGVGLVLGVIAGAGLAYFVALRSRRFTHRSEPELIFGVPLLGDVPDFGTERLRTPVPTRDAPLSSAAEAIRFIAATFAVSALPREGDEDGSALGSVAITSAQLREGKSVVLVNLAVAAAFQGQRVLVIDADFGHQNATNMLAPDAEHGPGLTEVVSGSATLGEAAVEVQFEQRADLHLLSRGRLPATAPDFFNAERTRQFLTDVRQDFDLVLVDTPPLLQVAYASTLLGSVDKVVVVVPHLGRVQPATELSQRLALIGIPVLGYVYNRSPGRGLPSGEGSLADVLGTLPTEPPPSRPVNRRRWGRRSNKSGVPG